MFIKNHGHGHGHDGFFCRRPSQRRVARETIMHARKPSSSSSVSSYSSTSSRSAGSSPSSPSSTSHGHDANVEYNPLALNPTFHAPPPLSERPLIAQSDHQHHYGHHHHPNHLSDPSVAEDFSTSTLVPPSEHDLTESLPNPPVDSPRYLQERADSDEDYFFMQVRQRPQLPRSHWSESTIMTLDQLTPAVQTPPVVTPTPSRMTVQSMGAEHEARPATMGWQNFSYKRSTVPQRPPMKPMDSVENFIKRGGWKRRGIVFQREEAEGMGIDDGQDFAG